MSNIEGLLKEIPNSKIKNLASKACFSYRVIDKNGHRLDIQFRKK